jgi:predicted outer membrane lipoprotein
MRLFSVGGGFGVTTGMVLIPFIGGVLLVFYDSKNKAGWLLGGGALLALVFGVISSIHLRLRNMSVFELLVLLVLCFGGLGLMLRSLKSSAAE